MELNRKLNIKKVKTKELFIILILPLITTTFFEEFLFRRFMNKIIKNNIVKKYKEYA